MVEPPAPPSVAAAASRAGHAAVIRLRGPIRRSDVAGVRARAVDALASGWESRSRSGATVVCDLGALDDPALATVEVLARLVLAARRNRCLLRLEHASPLILELLALCGLAAVLAPSDDSGREVGR